MDRFEQENKNKEIAEHYDKTHDDGFRERRPAKMSKYSYVRASGIRKLAKENGKRCGKDFLHLLDKLIYEKVLACCKQFNGHKKTLDGSLASLLK